MTGFGRSARRQLMAGVEVAALPVTTGPGRADGIIDLGGGSCEALADGSQGST